MKPVLLASLLVGTAMGAAPLGEPFGCGTRDLNDEERANHQEAQAVEIAAASAGLVARNNLIINTYVNIVASTDAKAQAITDATIASQIQVLNDNYAPSGISFTLQDTKRVVNATWAVDGDKTYMKKVLHRGTYADLNLYFLESLGKNLGYCYFPEANVKTGSTVWTRDGCTIRADTLPGNTGLYGLGKTATHEVGHWFGLAHTFEGGCIGPGDEIDDTPAQASASRGCPVGRDSCPDQPGLDPIHNYMDYSADSCYEEFSAGQQDRMHSMFNLLRKGV